MTPTELLRAHHLRVTPTRVAVLEVIEVTPHADADTIVRAVRERLGSVSVQAGYDVLHALAEVEIPRCIEPAGHPARDERRVAGNHTTSCAARAVPSRTSTARSAPLHASRRAPPTDSRSRSPRAPTR